MSFKFGASAAATATTGSTFGAKPAAAATSTTFGAKTTASTAPAIPPQKLTYEQLDANTKKLVEAVQEKFSEKMLADEIQQRVPEPIDRVTEDSSLMVEKLQTLLGTVNQDNQEALGLKKEYTALLRNVDQLTSLVERAGAMGSQMESRQAAWDNYQLANLPSKYFRDLVGTFESRMLEYRQTIETIEKFVDTSSSLKVYTPGMLKEVMQAQMEYFLSLASQVSILHDGLQDLQERCAEALKDRPGAPTLKFVDPYAPKVKKEKPVPQPRFENPMPEQPQAAAAATGAGYTAGAAKSTFGTGAATGFGAKPAGTTGYGTTGAATGFGAKPAAFGAGAGTTGFGAKPAGTGYGASSSFGSGAAKTGFGAGAGAAKTGFGSTGAAAGGFGAKPAGGFGAAAAPSGFRPTPAF